MKYSSLSMFRKTFIFVVLRLLVLLGSIMGVMGFVMYAQDLFMRMAGFSDDLIVMSLKIPQDFTILGGVGNYLYIDIPIGQWTVNAFNVAFGLVGLYIGYIVFYYLKKTILFYIQSAHVIAITKLCIEDEEEPLIRSSFVEIRKRFIGVSIFMLADSLAFKATKEVGNMVMAQDTIPVLEEKPTTIFGKLKNAGIRLIGRSISVTLNHCDELVLSYAFIQCRVRELYPEEMIDGSKAPKERIIFKYIVDGVCFYVRSCIPLLKKSFIHNISLDILSWVISIALPVLVYTIFDISWWLLPLVLLGTKLVYSIIHYVFVDPYLDINMVRTFYDTLFEMDTEALSGVRTLLMSKCALFKKLVSSTAGLSKDEGTVDESSLFGGDVTDTLLDSLEDALGISLNHELLYGTKHVSNHDVGQTEDIAGSIEAEDSV